MVRRALVLVVLVFGAARPGAQAPAAGPAVRPSHARNDYADGASWLCRPGRQDACAVDLTTTLVAADGTLTVETWSPGANPPIDCFYVYPTISLDPAGNSDMTPGPEERRVVQAQFARFASQCRTFAPLYRQITLTALRASAAGTPIASDRALAYNDVADAWNHYLAHDNNGRGVVLIGHSQGSGLLLQLLRNGIDGTPIQSRIVSAMLIGANVAVPRGRDVGGALASMPLCRSAQQTGCVISYVTFRSTVPPPPESRFGRVQGEGMAAACTNPAALQGGEGELRAYLPAAGPSLTGSAAAPGPWVRGAPVIATPYVSVPGLLSGRCVSSDKGTYLEVTVHANPSDPRTDDITGDVIRDDEVSAAWGLHLIDVQIAMGNLVEIAGRQARAYLATRRPSLP